MKKYLLTLTVLLATVSVSQAATQTPIKLNPTAACKQTVVNALKAYNMTPQDLKSAKNNKTALTNLAKKFDSKTTAQIIKSCGGTPPPTSSGMLGGSGSGGGGGQVLNLILGFLAAVAGDF